MKHKLLVLGLLLCGFLFSNQASAKLKIPIFYSNGTTFKTIHKLPDSVKIEGQHVNMGIAFDQFSIFWMPLWNYGTIQYVVVADNGETAWPLQAEELSFLKDTYKLDLKEKPSIPLGTQIGLKPVVLIIIALIIWGYLPKKKKEEEPANDESASNQE